MREIIKKTGSVYFSSSKWDILNTKINDLKSSTIFILVDANTLKYCLAFMLNKLELKDNYKVLEIPVGEVNKNIKTCEYLWNQLSENNADRQSLLINLGGGVVTDIGGFVASTFMRGIQFVNIPTTLLAMVDASIGGKNGVDLGIIKNQIGVINNPVMVLICKEFLNTLPKNQLKAGYAEVIKHGIIDSESYWDKIKIFNELNIDEMDAIIWESVLVKNNIITIDPFEKNTRKKLNYGHTLGHAIESYSIGNHSVPSLLHGEAIAIGMVLTTYISHIQCGFPKETLIEISNYIFNKFKKIEFNQDDIKHIIKLLKHDKKKHDNKVLFVLLNDIGKHQLNCEVPQDLIFEAFDYYKNIDQS